MNKELRTKSNQELCTLIMRLKLQLLESRFRKANGELEKTSVLSQIRKTIAKANSILHERGCKVSIGTHGVYLYDLKNKTTTVLSGVVQEALKAASATANKNVKSSVISATTANKVAEQKDSDTKSSTPIIKKELKSHMDKKTEKQVIHKTVGGGS